MCVINYCAAERGRCLLICNPDQTSTDSDVQRNLPRLSPPSEAVLAMDVVPPFVFVGGSALFVSEGLTCLCVFGRYLLRCPSCPWVAR